MKEINIEELEKELERFGWNIEKIKKRYKESGITVSYEEYLKCMAIKNTYMDK